VQQGWILGRWEQGSECLSVKLGFRQRGPATHLARQGRKGSGPYGVSVVCVSTETHTVADRFASRLRSRNEGKYAEQERRDEHHGWR
jgi:hypothetical protein